MDANRKDLVAPISMIELFAQKLNSFLKHLPCRKLKILKLTTQLLYEKAVLILVLSAPSRSDDLFFTLEVPKSVEDINRTIKYIANSLPEKYLTVEFQNVKEVLNEINYNFSLEDIPSTFSVVKLPYKQLAIKRYGATRFINLSKISYQRVLALFDRFYQWPAVCEFKDLTACMKRKELVVLLLSISD